MSTSFVLFLLAFGGSSGATAGRATLLIPMRDGVSLATNIFRPENSEGRSPVLLLRTAYNKDSFDAQAKRLAAAGYITLVQDCRGRFGSAGTFGLYFNEGQDGFDTVDWITRQPWSDGRVGTWGASFMGSTQWLTAGEGAPLAVMAPTAAASNFYYNMYLGGAYLLASIPASIGSGAFGPPPEVARSPEWSTWLLHLPLSEIDKAIGYPLLWHIPMMLHNRRDGFWRRADVSHEIEKMDIPAQHIVGYYDFFCRETVRNFQAMRERSATPHSRHNQQLILGPWDHATGRSKVADMDFGTEAELDVLAENLAWFDRFLKKSVQPETPFPAVRYFSMDDNVWHTATDWPPSEAKPQAFYLHSQGHANAVHGNGTLSARIPGVPEPSDTFLADPADPVPAVPARGRQYAATWGPTDQRLAAERSDVLIYSTPPLDKPLRFAGPLRAELYVSADTPDADWVVKLIDIHQDGFAHSLATGIQRGSFRDSEVKPTPLEPGKTYLLSIDLGHAAAQIEPGHSLRIQIAGSCFPLYDRNTHTGEGPTGSRTLVSSERVWHTPARPSRVWLPVISGTR